MLRAIADEFRDLGDRVLVLGRKARGKWIKMVDDSQGWQGSKAGGVPEAEPLGEDRAPRRPVRDQPLV